MISHASLAEKNHCEITASTEFSTSTVDNFEAPSSLLE